MSREIAKLEQELHVKLLTRLPTGIRVTREGAKFAEQILPLIERFDTLEESLIRETDQEINLFLLDYRRNRTLSEMDCEVR